MEAVGCQMGSGLDAFPNAVACPERNRRGACTVLDADGSADADGLSDVENPYTFTGRRLDVESDLMQYRNRYYHTGLGRFISRDPAGAPTTGSLYVYAADRPGFFGDATGLWVHVVEEMQGPSLETIKMVEQNMPDSDQKAGLLAHMRHRRGLMPVLVLVGNNRSARPRRKIEPVVGNRKPLKAFCVDTKGSFTGYLCNKARCLYYRRCYWEKHPHVWLRIYALGPVKMVPDSIPIRAFPARAPFVPYLFVDLGNPKYGDEAVVFHSIRMEKGSKPGLRRAVCLPGDRVRGWDHKFYAFL